MGGTRGREEGGARFLAALGIGLAAAIGRPAVWAGNPVCRGRRAGALGWSPASLKVSKPEAADPWGLELIAQKVFRFFFSPWAGSS